MSSTFPEPETAQRPTRVIAHRGASGYLPEHTAVAKALAYGLGADFIEQDVIATRDAELVVLHDIYLDEVSDVADKFPDRCRSDGRYYVIDFSLEEIGRIGLLERRRPGSSEARYPGRYPYTAPAFGIQRFEDELRLIGGLNAATGRRVGIYPEIKAPAWHAGERDIDLTHLLAGALDRSRDYFSGPVFVQSFDVAALKRFKTEFGAGWPLIRLVDARDANALARDGRHVDEILTYAVGVGLPYETLVQAPGGRLEATPLAATLGDAGLLIHPYTLRRDVAPPAGIDYRDLLRFLIRELGVDAIFCDFPDDAVAVRDGRGA